MTPLLPIPLGVAGDSLADHHFEHLGKARFNLGDLKEIIEHAAMHSRLTGKDTIFAGARSDQTRALSTPSVFLRVGGIDLDRVRAVTSIFGLSDCSVW